MNAIKLYCLNNIDNFKYRILRRYPILYLIGSLIYFSIFLSPTLTAQSAAIDTLFSTGLTLQNDYQDQAASDYYRQAIDLYADRQPDSLLGLIYHKLGAAYFNLYEEQKALTAYQQALVIRQQVLSTPHADIAKTSRMLGMTQYELGDYFAAESYLTRAYQIYQPLADANGLILTARELGKVYVELGDIEKSQTFNYIALEYIKNVDLDYQYLLPSIFLNIANLYHKQDSITQSIQSVKLGIAELESWEQKYDEDIFLLADAYHTLALNYQTQKQSELARSYYQRAIEINQKYPDLRMVRIALSYGNMGGLYKDDANFDLSKQYLTQAIEINKKENISLGLAANYINLGSLYTQAQQVDSAFVYLHLALTQLLPDWSPEQEMLDFDFKANLVGDFRALLEAFREIARAHRQRFIATKEIIALKQALEIYHLSTKIIDRARFEFQREGSKRFLLNTTQPILAEGIATAVQLYELTNELEYAERAFEFSERSKALILLEAVNDNKAKELAGIPLDLREQEQFYNQKVTYFTQQLYTERQAATPDLERLKMLNDSLLHYNTTLDNLVENIETDYPQYFQLKYAFAPITIKNIQKKILTEEKTLLEYFVADSTIYAFHITPQTVKIHQIKRDFPLTGWIEDLTKGITGNYSATTADNAINYDQLYADRAAQLYKKLWSFMDLPTVANQQITIIPDGVLGYIPFAALLTQPINNQQFKNYATYPFLINNHQISYSYSATLLAEQLQPPTTSASENLLAFAPTFGQMSLSLAANDRSGLSPLIHNRREVKSITEMMDGQPFYGADATREIFLENAPNYRYLHLSSHARMNDWKPEYSYVSFTQPMDDSLDKTALLYVDDLYNVPLNADMVVLSACETAAGKLSRGEGIISLARAFSYAGARSIITTLWRVNDQKSADLMIDFYENLAEGNTKDAALRTAQLQFIKEGTAAHPYFWAGFVPLGNMEEIEASGFLRGWYFYLVGSLLIFVIGLWWFRSK